MQLLTMESIAFFLFLRQGHQHLHYYFILKVHNIFKYLFIWPEVAKGNHDTSSSPLRSLIFDNTKNSYWSPVSKLIIEHLDWWDNCSSWYLCDYYTFFFFLIFLAYFTCRNSFHISPWLVTCLVISLFPFFPLTLFLFSSLGLPYVFSFTAHYSFLPGNPSPYFSCFFLLLFW